MIIFLFVLFISGCAGQEIKILKETGLPNPKEHISSLVKAPVSGMIENFETDLRFWRCRGDQSQLSRFLEEKNNVGLFRFKANFSREEYGPNISSLLYMRKMDFSRFSGIRFLARGCPDIVYKIKIYEKEDYFKGHPLDEIWFKAFKVGRDWQEQRIPFKEMQVEEYYEQDYVSDNLQLFTNITQIEITAQNFSKAEGISGELFVDDVMLYP